MLSSQNGRMGSYLPPRWSCDPVPEEVGGLRFELIRDGVPLDRDEDIALDARAFTILGRQPDICHAAVLHPSISRQHAVIQHGPLGAVFINDLGSTHGTKVNKAKLPAGQFVPLRVGDIVQFGLSSRLYCVEGPDRLRPPEWQSLQGPLMVAKPTIAAVAPPPNSDDEDDSESDGFDDDDEIDDLEQYLIQGTMQYSSLSKKQHKFVVNLNKKRAKLAHVRKELETLQTKESINGSLTAGQQTALGRCMQQLGVLQEEVDDLTDDLMQRVKEKRKSKCRATQSATSKSQASKRSRAANSDEDDDFYDRTALNASAAQSKRPKQDDPAELLYE